MTPMSRRFLALASSLLITAPLGGLFLVSHHASARPYYCSNPPKRGLTPRQEEQCEDAASAGAKKEDKNILKEPKYPFKSGILQSTDPSTGSQVAFQLISQNGSIIDVEYYKSPKPPLSLNPKEIVSWNSAIAGSGQDASGAVSVAVAGALFFWPMMLAAPFMIKNYTITGFNIEYIDEFGNDTVLSFATIDQPKPLNELLKFSTGLDAGAKRDPVALKPLYQSGLKKSEERLAELKKPITVVNSRKPWCSYLDLQKNSSEVQAYKDQLAKINNIRAKIGEPPYNDSNALSSDKQWQIYLDSNPSMSIWASANKSAAEKLRAC